MIFISTRCADKYAQAAGKASPSFVSRLLSDVDSFASESPEVSKAEQIDTIKGCAGLAYAAGAESVSISFPSPEPQLTEPL